jgi:hypothetical protein
MLYMQNKIVIKSKGNGVIFFGYPESGPDCSFVVILPIKLYNLPHMRVDALDQITSYKKINYLILSGTKKTNNGWFMWNELSAYYNVIPDNNYIQKRYLKGSRDSNLREKVQMYTECSVLYDPNLLVYKILKIKVKISKNSVFKNEFIIETIIRPKKLDEFFINKSFFINCPSEIVAQWTGSTHCLYKPIWNK